MNVAEPTILFQDLPLSPQVARAIQEMEYAQPTPIQAEAIPHLLNGLDVIGKSSTGTGKTAAFGIPAVECVDTQIKRPQVLIVSPTRELAMQIAREMQKFAKYKEGISVAAVYGGASMPDQIRMLKRANIVIGTPGRLMDHLRRKTLKMDSIKMVVLDEADEMLSMGFVEDIQTILSTAPEERQTVLFSATMPPPILKISDDFLTKPQIVDVATEQKSSASIEQTFYYVPHGKKQQALKILLQQVNNRRAIVFCNTKSMVDELNEILSGLGFRSSGLHGDMSQGVRSQVMQRFRNGQTNVLLATDVAARGLDIDDVELVINYDLPQSFEYYIHRIGRTGRAGKTGQSQTLICNGQQLSTLKSLMRFTGSNIEECRLPTSGEMMGQAIGDLATELAKSSGTPASKSAQQLVALLLEKHSIDEDQLVYMLAEKIVGEDKNLATFADWQDIPTRQPSPAKSAGSSSFASSSSMVTVIASIGRTSRITPNHIIGAIMEAIDLPPKSIGKIEIKDDKTNIGMRQDAAQALLAVKKKIRIAGESVNFRLQTPKSGAPVGRDRAPSKRTSFYADKAKKRKRRP